MADYDWCKHYGKQIEQCRKAQLLLDKLRIQTIDIIEVDSASDYDHERGRMLLIIEDLLKMYELTPKNMPAYGNWYDKNGGL